jgi:hypothetical protein
VLTAAMLAMTASGVLACGALAPARAARAERPPEVEVALARSGARTRVVLIAAPNLEINAQVAPALELAGGPVIRFSSPALTPDSAYFAAPPVAWLDHPADTVHGTLRVGVCERGQEVCRRIAIPL